MPEASPPELASPIDGVTLRFIESNGIRMRIAELGEGPLVLLAHGWPESWFSWRHQLPALAAAGYRVVAPDMRGYGETDAPEPVEAYDCFHLADDMVGILDALGVEEATLVGHDWGALVAPYCVLRHPTRFRALALLSVPHTGRGERSLVTQLKHRFGDDFFYILYHNEIETGATRGVAEDEYDGDPRGLLSRLYLSPDSPREAPKVADPKRAAGGWIPRLGAARGLPDWLGQDELDYYVAQFERAGFRGGVNYYRNFDRNWELTPQLADARIPVPTLFLAGEKDVVIQGATREQLTAAMRPRIPDLRGVVLVPEIGHWIQQEAPDVTNEALISFLYALDGPPST